MSQAIIDAHRDTLIASLKPIYAAGQICKPSAPTPNGRGGFIAGTPEELGAFVKKERDAEELSRRNVSPDMALIYVLNTLGQEVLEGWSVVYKGVSYLIKAVTIDPVETAFECACEEYA